MCPVCRMLQHPANRTHNPHQELKSIIQWLLPVVFRAVIFQVAGLVWSWELCVRCCSILQTEHITLSSTPDQQLEKPQHEISNHCIILLSS